MDPRKGTHVKLTFIGDRQRLGDIECIRSFLNQLVSDIKMKALDKPHCYSLPIVPENLPLECSRDEGGVTGVVVLSTSHAAIHTFPEHRYAVVDVYSCVEFDQYDVFYCVKTFFYAASYDIRMIDLSYSLCHPQALPIPKGVWK